MKKNIFILCVLINFRVSAQKEVSAQYDHIGKFYYGVAIVELKGKKGAIDSTGKEVIKPEWESLTGFGKDGIGYARKNGKVGLIKSDGTLLLEPKYERISGFHNGRAIINQGIFKGLVDFSGKIIIEPKYEHLKFEDNGLVRARQGGKEVLLKID
jgi:hypothetical protein